MQFFTRDKEIIVRNSNNGILLEVKDSKGIQHMEVFFHVGKFDIQGMINKELKTIKFNDCYVTLQEQTSHVARVSFEIGEKLKIPVSVKINNLD